VTGFSRDKKYIYIETHLEFNSNSNLNRMLGAQSINLIRLQDLLNVNLDIFGNRIRIYGETKQVKKTENLLNIVYDLVVNDNNEEVNYEFSIFETELKMLEESTDINENNREKFILETWKKTIAPKSLGQRNYLEALNNYDLVFGLGPAGTGKSYLAVAKGVELIKKGKVEKIILSRPAVEAGENLGFLPGDMKEKVDPYLRPIYDALYEMMPFDRVEKKIQNGDIEIAPLAFMRGRTFQNSFIIIDEAQNTTPVQMKMILTRIGNGSKMVVNGDLSQVDIPKGIISGLSVAIKALNKIDLLKIIKLSEKDVIRHPIVAEIIKAYDQK
tara:strand:- start:736 stop:1719 length:984 start_codon:yes stop_codon:yes gene_type:complete